MNDRPSAKIEREVAGWPGVSVGETGRGAGAQFLYGKVELGHLHGDSFADLPFPKKLRNDLVSEGRASVHPPLPDSGWVRKRMDGEGDAEAVISLLRTNYERAKARADRKPKTR
jgi:hypothetical protein